MQNLRFFPVNLERIMLYFREEIIIIGFFEIFSDTRDWFQLAESLTRKIPTSFTSDPLCQVKPFILINQIFRDWYLQIAASLNGDNFNPKAVPVLTDYFWQCDTGIVHHNIPYNQLHCAPAKLCIYF